MQKVIDKPEHQTAVVVASEISSLVSEVGLASRDRETSSGEQTTAEVMLQGRQLECQLVFESVHQGALLNGHSFSKCSATTCFSQYPLRVMLPSISSLPDCPCQWVMLMSFGGGMVAGDSVKARVAVGSSCCVLFTTQSFPKVYKSDSRKEVSEQCLNYAVEASGLLAVLSDPVVCFKDAHFRQNQNIRLQTGGSLILLDWFTAGRVARGERWDFHRMQSTTMVTTWDGKPLLRECLDMSGHDSESGVRAVDTMGAFGVTGTCILLGPHLDTLTRSLLKNLNARDGFEQSPCKEVLFSASPLPLSERPKWRTEENGDSVPSGCVLRFATTTTALAYRELSRLLEPIFHIFGEDPFQGKF